MSPSIGEQLRLARGARQISLEQAAKATRIRQKYLEALENDQWELLPSKVQGRGFMRLYADYLGLPAEKLTQSEASAESRAAEGPQAQAAPPAGEPDPAVEEELPPAPPAILEVEAPRGRKPSSENPPVFLEIGQMLRQRRETISLSLQDVERYTRLRARYLQALEEGRIYDLPSPVQGRGMLSNYASFLGLNSEEVLNRFAEGLQNRLATSRQEAGIQPRKAARKVNPTGWRRFVSLDVLAGSALILGLLAFAIWSSVQIAGQPAGVEPTPPSVSDVLLETRTQEAQLATAAVSNTPQATLAFQPSATIPIQGNEPLQVYIISTRRVWLKVIEDGKVVFSGRTAANTPYPFSAITQLEVYSGNAGGLRIYFNQVEISQLGQVGEPLELIFTAQGVITPTPLFTATPTATPQPTATLQPTRTQGAPTITPLIP